MLRATCRQIITGKVKNSSDRYLEVLLTGVVVSLSGTCLQLDDGTGVVQFGEPQAILQARKIKLGDFVDTYSFLCDGQSADQGMELVDIVTLVDPNLESMRFLEYMQTTGNRYNQRKRESPTCRLPSPKLLGKTMDIGSVRVDAWMTPENLFEVISAKLMSSGGMSAEEILAFIRGGADENSLSQSQNSQNIAPLSSLVVNKLLEELQLSGMVYYQTDGGKYALL